MLSSSQPPPIRGHLGHLLSSRRHLPAARARTTLPPAHISSFADHHPLDDSISLHKRAGWLSSLFACPCRASSSTHETSVLRCPPPAQQQHYHQLLSDCPLPITHTITSPPPALVLSSADRSTASLLPALVASSAVHRHTTTMLPPGLVVLSAIRRPLPAQSYDRPPQESRLVVCLFDTTFWLA
jgi:hypothetical protein